MGYLCLVLRAARWSMVSWPQGYIEMDEVWWPYDD